MAGQHSVHLPASRQPIFRLARRTAWPQKGHVLGQHTAYHRMDFDVQFANVERGIFGNDSVGTRRGTNGSADHYIRRRNLVSHMR